MHAEVGLGCSCMPQRSTWHVSNNYNGFSLGSFLMTTQSIYRIQPNYCTCSYKCTVKQFSNLRDYIQCTFFLFLYKTYVAGTHLNCLKSRQFKQVPTTYASIKKTETNIKQASLHTLLMKYSVDLSLKCALIRWIFYYFKFSQCF